MTCPAEVFCEIGIELKGSRFPAMTVGYSNGYVGYIPTRAAYEDPMDYASYLAPMFGPFFPFTPKVGEVLVRGIESLIDS